MKLRLDAINGKVIRDNAQYVLEDNTYLNNLTVSKTSLKPSQSTNGHKHDDLDEVYIFLSGSGQIEVSEAVDKNKESIKIHNVSAGDVVLIKGGEFHRVHNYSVTEPLIFTAIFQAYKR